MVSEQKKGRSDEKEELSLSKAADVLLNECRMVLPGIQALLGFQLIVVFSSGFEQKLGISEQRIHLLALGLIAVSVAIVMTPAAYHRQTDLREVSEEFVRLSTRLLLIGMIPLALGICLDFYLIAAVILAKGPAVLFASALFAAFFILWFVMPRARTLRRIIGGGA